MSTPAKRGKKIVPDADVNSPPEAKPEHKPSDYIQLFDKEGNLLWQTNHLKPQSSYYQRTEQEKHFIEVFPQILRDMHEADIDVSKLCLEDVNLSGANLSHANLQGASLIRVNFNQADLRYANLNGANLYDSSFDQARMTGADVTDCNLDDTTLGAADAKYMYGIIMLAELNDYFVWAYPRGQEKLLRIRAGCRDFTLAEARDHWSRDDAGTLPASGREEIFAALPLIEAMARNRGWAITVEEAEQRAEGLSKQQPTAEQGDEEEVDEEDL